MRLQVWTYPQSLIPEVECMSVCVSNGRFGWVIVSLSGGIPPCEETAYLWKCLIWEADESFPIPSVHPLASFPSSCVQWTTSCSSASCTMDQLRGSGSPASVTLLASQRPWSICCPVLEAHAPAHTSREVKPLSPPLNLTTPGLKEHCVTFRGINWQKWHITCIVFSMTWCWEPLY